MRLPVLAVLTISLGVSPPVSRPANFTAPPEPPQFDLTNAGQALLLKEAANASFFMLGELHGEREIPTLIEQIWPSMWKAGYRHIAAEISPWAASRLEAGRADPPIIGLWTPAEAAAVTALKKDAADVLWGCDIEEIRPQWLIRDLASANPTDRNLEAAVAAAGSVYQRQTAPRLLEYVTAARLTTDLMMNGVSLRRSVVQTLEVEADRSAGASLRASLRREAVMKALFHEHWKSAGGQSKVFLRFGRNHLHRGYDRRGVSTLGNFVAELGGAEHRPVFNVAAFAAGGKISLMGGATEFDERSDDPAFAYLASVARYPATVFDLRPIRQALHRLPEGGRSDIEASLVYWADSYDAIIFYRTVTPREH